MRVGVLGEGKGNIYKGKYLSFKSIRMFKNLGINIENCRKIKLRISNFIKRF